MVRYIKTERFKRSINNDYLVYDNFKNDDKRKKYTLFDILITKIEIIIKGTF